MSVSYNHRKKVKKQFKKEHGPRWGFFFGEHVDALVRAKAGPPIGTLADVLSPSPNGEFAPAVSVLAAGCVS
jgi:hypothetical protein